MEHQTIRWVRAADEGGVDTSYVPAQSRGRGLDVQVEACYKTFMHMILLAKNWWRKK